MKPRPNHDFDWQEQTGARPMRLKPQNLRLALWLGYGASQTFGVLALAAVMLITRLIVRRGGIDFGTGIMLQLLIIGQIGMTPFWMGFVAAYFWLAPEAPADFLPHKSRSAVAYQTLRGSTLLNVGIAVAILALWFGSRFFLEVGSAWLPFLLALLGLVGFLWGLMALGARVGAHFWRRNPLLRA